MKLIAACVLYFCCVLANSSTEIDEDVMGPTSSSHSFCGSDDCGNITVDGETVPVTDREELTEAFSKSEGNTINVNLNGTTLVATTVTTTTTTTPLPTLASTPVPSAPSNRYSGEDVCSCDTTLGLCNINCCCDIDCSDWDRKAFSHCIPEPDVPHSGLCYKQQFLYTNNTRYKVIQEEKGVFCIARDNFPERLFFSNQKTIHSTSSFNRAMKRKKQFTWPQKALPTVEAFSSSTPYKFNTPVWIYNSVTGALKTLELPLTTGSLSCVSSRRIRFLEEFESRCLHKKVSRGECENSQSTLNGQVFCENVILVSNPTLINQTKIEESRDDAFVPMRTVVCGNYIGGGCDCEEKNLTSPSYDSSTDTCMNTASHVHYVFFHNSTNGIVDAECRIVYETLQLGKSFSQHHQVSFRWAKNDSGAFTRSGAPGYLQGKPVISGNLLSVVADSVKRETVNMSTHVEEWFSLPVAGRDLICSGKRNILFKENLRSQCSLAVRKESLLTEEGCSLIKEQVWRTIFGDMKVNKSDPRQLLTLVSAFGDPSLDAPDDWVPIFLDHSLENLDGPVQAPCPTQINGVQYRVLYSFFGPFSAPQSKIIGLYAVLSTRDVECRADGCKLRIVTSVNFLDVSQQAVNKFAKAPIVKIRLPPDFFYPFSSNIATAATSSFYMAFTFLVLLFHAKQKYDI